MCSDCLGVHLKPTSIEDRRLFETRSLLQHGHTNPGNTEEHYRYAQLLAVCEMLQHPEYYAVFAPSCLLKDDRIVSLRNAEALSSMTIDGTYVDIIHIFTISSALNATIQSYTPLSHVCGLETSPYTRIITGRAVRQAKAPAMTLMWSATTVLRQGEPFTPNHIVLLAERHAGGSRRRQHGYVRLRGLRSCWW